MTPIALCSFCGKEATTDRLVAESGYRICTECVARSGRIVEEELGKR